ncbi:MAG: S8 family serine peptidase [Bdellovibrionales bacterium]|nr:S8 family serine peptidase [Bdellovibrionales bacterium]
MIRTGIHLAMMAAVAGLLTACGSDNIASNKFEKATTECEGEAAAGRFVVHFNDGRSQVVTAASKQEFLDGFVTDNLSTIEYAEHDFRVRMKVEPLSTIPRSTAVNNWGVTRVEADALWSQGVTGDGVTVAVIDSGMDFTHPQLVARALKNPGEMGVDANGQDRATNGIDDDGNGFIDDAIGFDFHKSQPLKGDYNYHGSHVAGIIAAEHADTSAGARSYVQGVAPGARILPLAFLNEDGDGYISDAVTAIKYAVQRGARVINASWGGTMCSRSLRQMVYSLEKKGIVFVAAAGNDSSNVDYYPEYPASLNLGAQITVGATGEQNYRAEYSNYGAVSVHIFAPGTNIVSTVPGGLGTLSGTSMATPMVAGAAALLLSAEPTASPLQLRQALAASASKRSDYVNASQGRMNLHNALAELRRLLQP